MRDSNILFTQVNTSMKKKINLFQLNPETFFWKKVW